MLVHTPELLVVGSGTDPLALAEQSFFQFRGHEKSFPLGWLFLLLP